MNISERDWYEDSQTKNMFCIICRLDFIGDSRRAFCRKCHLNITDNYDTLSQREKFKIDVEVFESIKNHEKSDPYLA